MKHVTLIFRSARRANSIEKVFSVLKPYWDVDYSISYVICPPGISGLFFLAKTRLSNKGNVIFHITGDIHWATIFFLGRNVVLTIHDINRFKYLKGLKKLLYKLIYVDLPSKSSDVITFVSSESKKQFASVATTNSINFEVIPNAYNSYRRSNSFPRARIPPNKKPNFLFIGSDPNKNLIRVLEALDRFEGGFGLTVIGRLSLQTSVQLNSLRRSKDVTISSILNVSEDELGFIYRKADVLIFPSTEEGFGLPVLEAQSAGVLVVTSRLEPLLSIGGDGCCYCDPYSTSDILRAIYEAVGILRVDFDTYIDRGRCNIKNYEPRKIAKLYQAVYDSFSD